MRKFEVVGGQHRRIDRKDNKVQVFKKGMVVASENDLCEKFKNVFKEVDKDKHESYAKKEPFKLTPNRAEAESVPEEVLKSIPTPEPVAEVAPAVEGGSKGKDVTDRYPEATKGGYTKVVRTDDKLYLLYTDDGEYEQFESSAALKDHLTKKTKKTKK